MFKGWAQRLFSESNVKIFNFIKTENPGAKYSEYFLAIYFKNHMKNQCFENFQFGCSLKT